MSDVIFVAWLLMGILVLGWGIQRWIRKRKDK
jgi:hypothetical protein